MMDTILNLGLNDRSVRAWRRATGDDAFAHRSFARLLAMYGRIVMGGGGRRLRRAVRGGQGGRGVDDDARLSAQAWKDLCRSHKAAITPGLARRSPRIPWPSCGKQSRRCCAPGTALVRSRSPRPRGDQPRPRHRGERAGHGVRQPRRPLRHRRRLHRDAATGEDRPYGDFLVNARPGRGRGRRRADHPAARRPRRRVPRPPPRLLSIMDRLEAHYRDMLDLEFTIEQDRLWMLQVRVGKRTGVAALRMAVGQPPTRDPPPARAEAVGRITPDHLDQILHPRLVGDDGTDRHGAGRLAGCRRRRRGVHRRRRGGRRPPRHSVILWKETNPRTCTACFRGLGHPHGRGGLVSRAAVVARGWGKPAVVGADAIVVDGRRFLVGDLVVHEAT
ncbi:MAG: PEP/pyruvate-binding domain-containing protein [Acidimicrobiales bacterium]